MAYFDFFIFRRHLAIAACAFFYFAYSTTQIEAQRGRPAQAQASAPAQPPAGDKSVAAKSPDVNQLPPLPPEKSIGRITVHEFPGGHMFYTREANRVALHKDVVQMYGER